MKKIMFFIFGLMILSCSKKDSSNENHEYIYPTVEVIPEENIDNQFFINNNLKPISLSESDLTILKKAYEVGIFKEKSLCQFYKEYKTLELQSRFKESDEVISSFKKVEGLEFIFAVNGHALCPEQLSEVKAQIYNSPINQTYYPADNACIMSEDFIKQDLVNPSTADFSMFDCTVEKQSDGSYVVLRKVGAKNALGVKKEYIYKLRIAFLGGNKVDINHWKLIGIQSEEYR